MTYAFLRTLIALAYLVSATVSHASFLINSYAYGTAPPPAGPVVNFLQCASDDTDANPYTFVSQNVGTAAADRYNIVVVMAEDSANSFGTSSVTIGGGAGTERIDSGNASSALDTSIYTFLNTAGTSENIVVTFSEAVTSAHICVFEVTGLVDAGVATDTAATFSAGAAITLDTDVTAAGFIVGGCIDAATGPVAWTGLTEIQETSSAESTLSVASHDASSASTPLSITCDPTAAGSASVASFE